jgi:hypothetical protein
MNEEEFRTALQKLEAQQIAIGLVMAHLLDVSPEQVRQDLRNLAPKLPDLLIHHRLTDRQLQDIQVHVLSFLREGGGSEG